MTDRGRHQAASAGERRGLLTVATWIGVYPVLTVLAWLLEPVTRKLPLVLDTLLISALWFPSWCWS